MAQTPSPRRRARAALIAISLTIAAGCSSPPDTTSPDVDPLETVASDTTPTDVDRSTVPASEPPPSTDAGPSATEPATSTAPGPTASITVEPAGPTPASFPVDSALGAQLAGTAITPTQYTVGEFAFDALVAGPADGETAILLHGFPSTNYQWRFQITALADAGYRVIAPNQRGYSPGARPIDVADYDIDLLARDVVDIATAAGVDQFHLVGHDWGAAVTWAVGINHPGRLLSLTAVSVPHPAAYGTARLDPTGEQTSKAGYIDLFVQEGFEDAMVADDAAFLRGIYASSGLTTAEMQPYLDVLGTSAAAGAALNWYRANSLSASDAAPVATPTLFVFSTDDCCLGRDAADLTVDYVAGPYTYEILEGISHWITEEAPTELNSLLLAHLDANPPAS